jgi:hypothetical protein
MAPIGPGSSTLTAERIVLAVTPPGSTDNQFLARSANAFAQMNRITNDWDPALRGTIGDPPCAEGRGEARAFLDGAAGLIRDFWDDVAARPPDTLIVPVYQTPGPLSCMW